jgi:general secretion pathway protein B
VARSSTAAAPAATPDAAAPAATATTAASTVGAPALPRLRELAADLRRELPPLAVSGSVYSPDAPSRMLVLDGQVVREGQSAAPGVLVEQIGPKAAVLSFKGQRFELPYGP